MCVCVSAGLQPTKQVGAPAGAGAEEGDSRTKNEKKGGHLTGSELKTVDPKGEVTDGQENKWNVLCLSTLQCDKCVEAIGRHGADNTSGPCRNLSATEKGLCGSCEGEVPLICKWEEESPAGRD